MSGLVNSDIELISYCWWWRYCGGGERCDIQSARPSCPGRRICLLLYCKKQKCDILLCWRILKLPKQQNNHPQVQCVKALKMTCAIFHSCTKSDGGPVCESQPPKWERTTMKDEPAPLWRWKLRCYRGRFPLYFTLGVNYTVPHSNGINDSADERSVSGETDDRTAQICWL